MVRSRSTRRLGRVALIVLLALAIPGAGAAAKRPTPEPTAEPARAVTAMPELADGDVAVHFSLAPATPEDTELTVLTRWRTCGIWREGQSAFEPADEDKGVAATAHLVATDEEVRIRVDAGTGPDGEPCDAEQLVRLRVALEAPLGERTIRDTADDTYQPVINLTDSVETYLTYSCTPHDDGEHFSVVELLGPGLGGLGDLPYPPTANMRIVRVDGDIVHGLDPVQPRGKILAKTWRWSRQKEAWSSSGSAYRCRLFADSGPNQTTATWRFRGQRPNAGSKAINVWVREEVCNGRPLYGRVAQPTWIEADDGIIFVTYSMRDTVLADGTYIDDPWTYYKGKPGVASRSSGGFAFVDCPGIGPAPYTFNLWRRLGDRKLYDGAFFPPRERPARSDR